MPAPDIEGWGRHEFGKYVRYGFQIEESGGNQDTYLNMPVPHRLLRMELKQTDTNDNDATSAFAYYLRRGLVKGLLGTIRSGNTTGQYVTEVFAEGFESDPCLYAVTTNGTNTNHTYAFLTFELLP